MNLTKYLLATILVLMSAKPSFANEEENKQTSFIAVVDLHSIIENSLAVKDLNAKCEKIKKDLLDKMTLKQLELKQDESRLIEQKGQKSYQKDAGVFSKKVSETQKEYQQQKVKLEKAHSDGMMQINRNIVDITKSFCQKKGCSIVLPSSQVLYAENSLNISLEILEKLNQQISSINVNF
jgi:Skp family chaperone for outer membrane proteins